MLLANKNKSVWFVYIASLLTPLTCLLSGVIAIIYAGYRLDKDQDGEPLLWVNSKLFSFPHLLCGVDCHRGDRQWGDHGRESLLV